MEAVMLSATFASPKVPVMPASEAKAKVTPVPSVPELTAVAETLPLVPIVSVSETWLSLTEPVVSVPRSIEGPRRVTEEDTSVSGLPVAPVPVNCPASLATTVNTFEPPTVRLVAYAPAADWMPVGVMVEMFAPLPTKIEVELVTPAWPVGAAIEAPLPKLIAPLSVPPARGR